MIKRSKYCNNYAIAMFFIAELEYMHGIKAEMTQGNPGGYIVTWLDPDGNHRF